MTHRFDYESFSLFTGDGQRKYLNAEERRRFYRCTMNLPYEKRLFCWMVYFTGARLNEIARLRIPQLDLPDKKVILQTLKQGKGKIKFRQMSLPDHVLNEISHVLDTRKKFFGISNDRLWSFSARTGARAIKKVMKQADINDARSNARGLRHGFAVHASNKAPLTQVRKWLGHADLKTTAIYLSINGQEERQWAESLWDELESYSKKDDAPQSSDLVEVVNRLSIIADKLAAFTNSLATTPLVSTTGGQN